MVRVVAADRDCVAPGFELACDIDVPLKFVIVPPPGLRKRAVPNQLAVDVEPAFIEEAGEHEVNFASRADTIPPPSTAFFTAIGCASSKRLFPRIVHTGELKK